MECTVFAPGIHGYQCSDEEFTPIANLVAQANSRNIWVESVTLGGKPNYRMSRSFHITRLSKTDCPDLGSYDAELYRLFNSALRQYESNFDLRVETDEGYELLHYPPGGQYKKHIDQGGHQYGRIVSGILYMNDNFKGGGLQFTRFDLTIQPRQGLLLLFPSNYVYEHIAQEIVEGEKYAIVTFFHPLDEVIHGHKTSTAPNSKQLNGAVNL